MPTHVTESTGATVTSTWEFTTGTLSVSTAATFKVGTITEQVSGSGITVDGVLLKDGAVTLSAGTSLPVSSGGTGATVAASARSSLGVAASGANSDITSLGGLTTPLTVAQGGTGTTVLNAGGLVYASGTTGVTTTQTGVSGYGVRINTGGVPVVMPLVEYVAVICNAPSTSNTAASDVARFQFPFNGYLTTAVAGVSTAPTGTTFAVDVRNGTVSFFTTTMRMDPGEFTSATATTPAVVNTATSTFNAWDTCRIHVDSEGITSSGLWVTLVCVRTN